MNLGRRAALGGLLATGGAGTARADAWPEKTVTWIVPFAAGGVNDAFARPVAAHVGASFGQTMVVDNRSGAGGTLGAAIVARVPADGYTLLVANTSHTYAPVIYPTAGFDILRDFAPVSAFARVQYALIVNPAVLPVVNLQQFIERVRQKPGSIDVASGGLGTVSHLAIELLEARTNIQLNHMPYRGGGPALQDLLAGHVAAQFSAVANLQDYIRSGRLRVLAVAGRRREPGLPDVPTMQEAGIADFRAAAWFGLFAPKRTPAAILDRLHGAVQATLGADDVRRAWAEQGAKVEPESRAEFARFVGREVERWSKIAKATEIDMD
jgi:tripartite-type tricarboxylate transporter receptor subunit TctC